MIERLRSERGFSLIELLAAMTLMLIVMGATLNTLENGGTNRRANEDRNDAVEKARSSMDNIVRQLRNLASPSPATPDAIDRAQATDFSFRTFDPNKRLVRYCLQTTPAPASLPITGTSTNLIQMLSNTHNPGSYADCTLSTANWTSRRIVASDVVNRRTSSTTTPIDVFAYNGTAGNTSTITNVRLQLAIDINTEAKVPGTIKLASGAALRNQNQRPTATFTVTAASPLATNREFILNGTNSNDPENRNLTFTWYADQAATFTPSAANFLGNGPVLDRTLPLGSYPAGTYYFKLVVSDSNLTDTCPTSAGVSTACPTAGPITLQ